jgi:hypothetical protein
MVFTTAVGRFTFDPGTPLSQCKIVRDSVIGGVLSPPEGTRKLKTAQEAYDYVRDSFGHVLSDVKFSFVMTGADNGNS